jgi:hypothetical protein
MTRSRFFIVALAIAAAAALLVAPRLLVASDHDDGETDTKGRNVNLTDLYAFREVDQNPVVGPQCGSAGAPCDLILIMNVNPRSVAREQYYFSTRAKYEFKVTRVADKNATPTGQPDAILRFQFSAPDANRRQQITLTTIRSGTKVVAAAGTTSALNDAPIINAVHVDSATLNIYSGLREDPFFFDVEQFFRVRAGLAGFGPPVGFRNPGLDFTAGYNVLSIVVRLPRAFLQGSTDISTFDVWETISVRAGDDDDEEFVQVERLARPAINEGLLLTNDFHNLLNAVGPDDEAAALAGRQPQANLLGPVVAEAKTVLLALPGNNEARANALLGAFLPDVMRIDTTGPSGYANALNTKGSPIRGRMILDDVIDITLTVLTNSNVTSDNVSYSGPNLGGSGHKPLLTTFPYLASPN